MERNGVLLFAVQARAWERVGVLDGSDIVFAIHYPKDEL